MRALKFQIENKYRRMSIGSIFLISFGLLGDQVNPLVTTMFQRAGYAQKSLGNMARQNEWDELEIDRLITTIDRTQTVFGKYAWQSVMSPVDDINVLKKRQSFIQLLTENDDLYHKMRNVCKTMQENESAILSYWDKKDGAQGQFDYLYYNVSTPFPLGYLKPLTKKFNEAEKAINNRLNNSSKALDFSFMKYWFDMAQNVFNLAFSTKVTTELLNFIGGGKSDFKSSLRACILPVDMNNIFTNRFGDLLSKDTLTDTEYNTLWNNGTLKDRIDVNKWRLGSQSTWFAWMRKILMPAMLPTIIFDGALLYSSSTFTRKIKHYRDWFPRLYEHMVKLASFTKAMEDLNDLMHGSPESIIKDFVHICLPQQKQLDTDTKRLLDLLHKDTFKSSNSFWYSRGNILLAHKLMKEKKDQLIPLLYNVALLDVYVSIATYIREMRQAGRSIRFAKFAENKNGPSLHIQDGWLPIVPGDKIITNSAYLGDAKPRNIILTGPNGCGKSTYLKMIGINSWLVHTAGFGCASEIIMTPLHAIRTSLCPAMNLSQGLSTFMAEADDLDELREFISSSDKNPSTLILISEPYRGTVEIETSRKILEFGHFCAPMQNIIMGLETHVFEPTKLANEFPGVYTNGHMAIKEQADGSFERPFILQDGPANWWFFDHAKRARFVDWVMSLRKKRFNSNIINK